MARAYQHQHFAEAPRGWRVRSKHAGDHVLRVAFPPGRRRRGAGRLLEILHPKKNPACENGECAIAQNPAEELLIFGNPAKSDFSTVYIVATPRRGGDQEIAGPYHITRREAKRIAKERFPSDSYFRPRITTKEPKRKTVPYRPGPFSRFLGNPGEYVKAMADRLEANYRELRREGQGHEEAMTSVIARAGADAKTIAEFKRRIGNPPRRVVDRSKHATGRYSVGRDVWQRDKWAVYSPTGVSVGLFEKRRDADDEAARLNREKNPRGGIGNHKPGCKCGFCKRLRRHRNPDEIESAQRLFKIFHGRDPQAIANEHRSAAMRSEYTTLGDLEYLIVDPPDKPSVKITFDEDDDVKLASAANGRQLYVIGGNQNLDAMLAKFTEDPGKDFIDLGEGIEVQYLARKIHGNFQPVEWFHKFGREHGQPLDGERPRLMYDKLKKEIFFVGGEYFIDTNVAISPGIEN